MILSHRHVYFHNPIHSYLLALLPIMQIKTALVASTLAAATMANPLLNSVQKGGFCGSVEPTEAQRQESRDALAKVSESFAPQEAFAVTVPVYMHVIAADETVAGGYLEVSKFISSLVV